MTQWFTAHFVIPLSPLAAGEEHHRAGVPSVTAFFKKVEPSLEKYDLAVHTTLCNTIIVLGPRIV